MDHRQYSFYHTQRDQWMHSGNRYAGEVYAWIDSYGYSYSGNIITMVNTGYMNRLMGNIDIIRMVDFIFPDYDLIEVVPTHFRSTSDFLSFRSWFEEAIPLNQWDKDRVYNSAVG